MIWLTLPAFLKQAGVERIHPHRLRHTFATRLVTAGVNPRIAQELLGHEDISTTMKIYAEVETSAMESAIEKMSLMTSGSALSESVASQSRTIRK